MEPSEETAASRALFFFMDVQNGRDPQVVGGSEDPFGCAYAQLCKARRAEVSQAAFRDTGGAAISELLTANAVRPAEADAVPSASRESSEAMLVGVEALWYERHASGGFVVDWDEAQPWRVELVPEEGHWRVCDFTSGAIEPSQ